MCQKNQRLASDLLPRKPAWEAHGKQREEKPGVAVPGLLLRVRACVRAKKENPRRRGAGLLLSASQRRDLDRHGAPHMLGLFGRQWFNASAALSPVR